MTDDASGFTCPMHPEILTDRPGNCPSCGMALEPVAPPAGGEETADPELRDMTHRLVIGAILTAPVFLIAMSGLVPGLRAALATLLPPLALVEMVLTTPVVLYCGWPFFRRGWDSIVNRRLNMFTLIAIGTGTAYTYSTAAALLPDAFPAGFRALDGGVDTYFEAAAVITVLVLMGQVLELRARGRTRSALSALAGLTPRTALRLAADGSQSEVPLSEVHVGDRLRVRPGERLPVDGVVVEGRSGVDESVVTGESIPVEKGAGDRLIGGSINGTGGLVMRAERVGSDTLLARIVRLVAEAQRSRAPIQRLADAVSSYFVPAVVTIAAASFAVWSLVGPPPRLAHALLSAVTVLIVACPCALGLATPMSIMVGTGRGAGAGVLIRDAEALEVMERVDTLVVDKTGTLTEGRPRLAAVQALEGMREDDLLRLSAALERGSEHPLAAAVVDGAAERGLPPADARDLQSHPGLGVTGRVDGRQVALGNEGLMRRLGIDPGGGDLHRRLEDQRREGRTAVLVAVDGRVAGLLGVADPIRPTTPEAIAALRRDGIRIVMLTGDSRNTARAVAGALGIDELEAEVRPEGKAAFVRRLKAEGRIVAMAGDGVNDAPALALADVGIAMGTGTDIAMESAGVTLMKGDLRALVRARRLSRGTMRNIRQNLFFAFAYNALCIPLAAGVLYPVFGWLLSPMIAGAAMSLSSVTVIGNALRLRRLAL